MTIVSHSFGNVTSYVDESQIPLKGDDPVIYSNDFVPQNTGGNVPTTDYVSALNGGIFSAKISYPSALTLSGNYDIVYKLWVENYVSTQISSAGFESIFDALFAQKSITGLASYSHNSTQNIDGGEVGAYYHLTQSQHTNATRVANGTDTGLLSNTDWNTFNKKLGTIIATSPLFYDPGANTISVNVGLINHDALLNYSEDRHLLRNDSGDTFNDLWSASKIISYVASQIPGSITDYVSKASGGNYDAIIGYSTDIPPVSSTDIPNKAYTDGIVNSSISSYNEILMGSSSGSILELLGTFNITSFGIRQHNSLTDFQGGTTGQYYHLTQAQYSEVVSYASSTQNGLLSSTDWIYFSLKLDAFSTARNPGLLTFLDYNSGILYYNEGRLDHNLLLNYDIDQHRTLNDAITSSTTLWSSSKIASMFASDTNKVYTIRLNAGSTVAQRISGLTAGVDYPTGWTLSYNDVNLIIQHNLDKLVADVFVYSKNGSTGDVVKLTGNVAYSTLTNIYSGGDYDSIRLDALATIQTELYIKIII